MKWVIVSIFLLFASLSCHSQIPFIRQIGLVVYSDFEKSRDELKKKKSAVACSEYITSKRFDTSLLVYLIYDSDSDGYQLSFDNLYGNSIDNSVYDRKGIYYQPGIRIVIPMNRIECVRDIYKLIDYGYNNLDELVKIRNKAIEYNDKGQIVPLYLGKEKIDKIVGFY